MDAEDTLRKDTTMAQVITLTSLELVMLASLVLVVLLQVGTVLVEILA
jgi:hypothetical protein